MFGMYACEKMTRTHTHEEEETRVLWRLCLVVELLMLVVLTAVRRRSAVKISVGDTADDANLKPREQQ